MPGGTQSLSKRPEMFLPEQWPTYFKSAKGAEVVDLDGKTYLDMSYCGVGATILGFADPDVDAAVKSAIRTHCGRDGGTSQDTFDAHVPATRGRHPAIRRQRLGWLRSNDRSRRALDRAVQNGQKCLRLTLCQYS